MGTLVCTVALAAILGPGGPGVSRATPDEAASRHPPAAEWQREFAVAERHLVPGGRNRYFVLEPGYRLEYASEDAELIITVLADTVRIGGVTARVVEEREWEGGRLIEVSRNYFARDPTTNDVFYFGEDVDDYDAGGIVGHGGSWRADAAGARPGLIMPGAPEIGMKYFQEIAPGVAMDRAEVVSLDETFETPAGVFGECLKTREGSALYPEEKEFKIYAPGIGLIRDGEMSLVGYGFRDE